MLPPSSANAQVATHAEECSRMHMAIEARRWTLEEMHALPEDGNKYELIHGELLVTPAPTNDHETIASRLARLLDRYVESQHADVVRSGARGRRAHRSDHVAPIWRHGSARLRASRDPRLSHETAVRVPGGMTHGRGGSWCGAYRWFAAPLAVPPSWRSLLSCNLRLVGSPGTPPAPPSPLAPPPSRGVP
ncbi:MAG: Uma2 family endonuclease [Gemmatimonadaceae bacterium]